MMTWMAIAVLFACLLAALAWSYRARERRPPERGRHPQIDTPAARVAAHEAGHVVAAWSCAAVSEVSRVEMDDDGGTTYYRMPIEGNEWSQIVISLAGICAESMIFRRWKSGPSRHDMQTARALASALQARGEDTPPWTPSRTDVPLEKAFFDQLSAGELETMQIAYAEAQRIVDRHAKELYLVAGDLLATGRLDRDHLASRLPRRYLAGLPWQRGRFMI